MKLLKAYACYNVEEDVRLSSSSGGIFSVLAEYVFSKNGIVYGVAMSEDCYSAKFIGVTNKNELVKLRGSKYLQAKVGDTYKKIKSELLLGKEVLFTGTGCQVNGLKSFLGRDYENLICVDIICHGVPSAALWKKYAQYQEHKNHGKLKEIQFRCKDKGWAYFGIKEHFEKLKNRNVKKIYISKDEDYYMQMFLKNYCLRPSCYECTAKNMKMADLTIADFWGIDEVVPEMNDGKGVSLVLIRNERGEEIFGKIGKMIKQKEVSYENGVKKNSAEYKSCVKPLQREKFFCDMQYMDFEMLKNKYIKLTFKSRLKKFLKKARRVWGGSVNEGLLFVLSIREETL